MVKWCFNRQWMYRCFALCYCLLCTFKPHAQEQTEILYKKFPSSFTAGAIADSAIISQWIQKGIRQQQHRKEDSALFWFHKAYVYSRYSGYNYGVVTALSHMGNILVHQGCIDSALDIYSLMLHRSTQTDTQTTKILLILGNIYTFKGEYTKGAIYYDSSLKISRKLGDDKSTAGNMVNLGGVYLRLNRPDEALRYIKQGEAICRQKGYMKYLSTALHNKGEAYLGLNRLNEARTAFLEELATAQKINNRRSLVLAYGSLGLLALRQGNPQKAIVYLKEAERRFDPRNPYHLAVSIRSDLGKAYYQLKQYNQAEYQLKMVLKNTKNQDIKDDLIAVHKTLAAIYKATGRYRKALEQQEQYEQLKDSLFARQKIKDINELQIKYRSSEKDKQLLQERARLHEKDLRLREKNFWIAGIMLVALLIAALFIALYRNIRHRQKAILKNEELKRLQALIEGEEKERSRIARELHDGLGGMLVAINMNVGMIKKAYPQAGLSKVEQMVDEAGIEARKTAHNLMPNVLEKHDLKEALLLYCERVNEGNGVQLQLQFDEALPVLDKSIELILYRIIQELVQNIAKHAQAAQASIQLIKYEGQLVITVEDNGKGFDLSIIKNGLGLDNVKYRVNTLKGTIHISSAIAMGTTIHIEFALNDLVMGG